MSEETKKDTPSPDSEESVVREFTLGLAITGVWTISYSLSLRPDLAGKPGFAGNSMSSMPEPETEMLDVEFMIALYGLDQEMDEPPILHIRTLNRFHIPGMKEITEGDNVFIPKNLMVRIADAAHDTARGLILAKNGDTAMQYWVLPMLNPGFVTPIEKWPEGSGERGLDVVRLSTTETLMPLEEKIKQERMKEKEARLKAT